MSAEDKAINHLHLYTEDYYSSNREEWSWLSANVIVPLVLDLVQPRSVIDIGCGTGEWLSVFKENGVEDFWGVDGAYVNNRLLKIPEERFIAADLEQPFRMNRKFDLVISLEVAEHLPSRCAGTFVNSLTRLGPLVLFSAAIPHQGGVGHINEQWPEYWAKLFNDRGYVLIDCLRRRIWDNEEVQWYYAQNILMFAVREHLENYPLLSREYELHDTLIRSVVHPRLYMQTIEEAKLSNLLVHKGGLLAYKTWPTVKRMLPSRIQKLVRAAIRGKLLGTRFSKG